MRFAGTNLIIHEMPEKAEGMSRQSLAVRGFARFNGKKGGKSDDTRTV